MPIHINSELLWNCFHDRLHRCQMRDSLFDKDDVSAKGIPNVLHKKDISELLPLGYKLQKEDNPDGSSLLSEIIGRAKSQNNNSSNMVPKNQSEIATGINIFKFTTEKIAPTTETDTNVPKLPILQPSFATKNPPVNVLNDVWKFLPPGYKEVKSGTRKPPVTILEDASKFLPPGYKAPKTTSKPPVTVLEDVFNFLPPGFKETKTDSPLKVTKDDADVTKFLPPGYKLPRTTNKPPPTMLDDVSKFLPAGYKQRKYEKGGYKTTEWPKSTLITTEKSQDQFIKRQPVNSSLLLPLELNKSLEFTSNVTLLTNLLPADFKSVGNNNAEKLTSAKNSTSTALKSAAVGEKKQIKLVFPGQKNRKTSRLTAPKSSESQDDAKPSAPTIHKGWPSRATTEFTGWPTPSTTPISVEKLLEAARTATASYSITDSMTDASSTTTTTTTTTTTAKPTTPGICRELCELAGTIKILDNKKWNWKPEYLDRNTQEYQDLANAVKYQLNEIYRSSAVLKNWYKNIRVDGFSQGSILVDYFVELNDVGSHVNTLEIKRLFYEALMNQDVLSNSVLKQNSGREGKALNETAKADKLTLGQFDIDPKYTDFVVIPKSMYPTVGYAEDNVLLPQWAIAVIVIGLASLLFVIIFGVTVLVNRRKSSKKKGPTPLTEDMLSELNKNHMGGFDNYGASDLYNMEDVWNERAYEQKPKKQSNGSINENSTTNLYDSWRSDWNGYYYNNYYGNSGSQHSGYSGRRRSDYDTNF